MRNYLSFLLLLFFGVCEAQVPDSLNVKLPWDVVYVSECQEIGEGPLYDYTYLSVSSVHQNFDIDGECFKTLKIWTILNWNNGEIYTQSQIGKIGSVYGVDVVESVEKSYVAGGDQVSLIPEDLISNVIDGHKYSFSYWDSTDVIRLIDLDEVDDYELYLYDHTARSVSKTKVYVTECEELTIMIPDTVDIVFDKEPYIVVGLDDFGIDIDYPCGTYTIDVHVYNVSNKKIYAHRIGSIIPVKITMNFSDGQYYQKSISLNVVGEKPDPVLMFLEEKSFLAGETVNVEVWSEEISILMSWQFQFRLQNAKFEGVTTGAFFDLTPAAYHIFNSDERMNVLWFPGNALPINVEADSTWFVLSFIPDFDGSTIDVFEIFEDNYSTVGKATDQWAGEEYDVDFSFNIVERSFLTATKNISVKEIEISPNPTSNRVKVSGLSDFENQVDLRLVDVNGKSVVQQSKTVTNGELSIDISTLPNGLYFLRIDNGTKVANAKVIKI